MTHVLFLSYEGSMNRLAIRATIVALATMAGSWTSVSHAADGPDHAIVAGGSLDGPLLFNELNCAACHAATELSIGVTPYVAPILSDAGARITPQYMRAFLSKPHETKAGTKMPDLLHGLSDAERADTVEKLVHYLQSLGGPTIQTESGASEPEIDRGQRLFHTVGCVACHKPQAEPSQELAGVAGGIKEEDLDPDDPEDAELLRLLKGPPARPFVPLGDLASKTTVEKLAAFLQNPLHTRPSGRMPSLNLDATDARFIAAYLLRDQLDKKETGWSTGVQLAFWNGNYNKVPDFASIGDPVFEANLERIDQQLVRMPNGQRPRSNFAIRIDGALHIENAGEYSFFIRSDDGGVLKIDGKTVVDNDGIHAPQDRDGKVRLDAGWHELQFGLIQGGGDWEFKLEWQPPDGKKTEIPAGVLMHRGGHPMIPRGIEEFTVDQTKASAGRELFVKHGCKKCHHVENDQQKYSLAYHAPDLNALNAASPGGCLSPEVPRGRPKYDLSEEQRTALTKAVKELQKPAEEVLAVVAAHRNMEALNCYNCHARDGKGGLSNDRKNYFETIIEIDIGDEGRIPPKLDHVGAKLTPDGFAKFLWQGYKAREYMAARMPQFGKDNVASLPEVFREADRDHIREAETPFSEELVDDGRLLVGKTGLGCVNCHSFGPYKIQGAAGLDLWEVTSRLEPGWTHALIRNPQAVNPGTRMPNPFPQDQVYFPDVQDGVPEKQIAAIWAYLSTQEKGGLPVGIKPGDSNVLVVADKPVVFRTFLRGVGAHAVTIGFRQRTHMAFDALRIRSAKAWTGEFVSADPSWEGRAGQYAPILGGDEIDFPPDSPFATLEAPETSWPVLDTKVKQNPEGWQFLGYSFDADRNPTMRYRFNGVTVGESPSTEFRRDGALLRRNFALTAETPPEKLFFRVALGKSIKSGPEGTFLVDDKLTVKVTSPGSSPIVRETPQGTELLLPVVFDSQPQGPARANFEVDFSW